MAQRPKRFKRVSVSFPIDLYAKVDAAYRAAPPHSINSWIVEACRAEFSGVEPEVVKRREPSPLLKVPGFTPQANEERAERAAQYEQEPDGWRCLKCGYFYPNRGDAAFKPPVVCENCADEGDEAMANREFGPKTLAVAARSVRGWHDWDWKQRLEHLRELKAAAVSG